eukprot:TRINITY_DN20540_c0_g1_i3.p1 TRINITY_DN20540_c0_g1~~TRINITY_DN20540_c0_g1_i3.p1  ORF type:complete len:257 (-),score=21.88 TRINITY_DN20540_c0_g1_i3:386-1084(-)
MARRSCDPSDFVISQFNSWIEDVGLLAKGMIKGIDEGNSGSKDNPAPVGANSPQPSPKAADRQSSKLPAAFLEAARQSSKPPNATSSQQQGEGVETAGRTRSRAQSRRPTASKQPSEPPASQRGAKPVADKEGSQDGRAEVWAADQPTWTLLPHERYTESRRQRFAGLRQEQETRREQRRATEVREANEFATRSSFMAKELRGQLETEALFSRRVRLATGFDLDSAMPFGPA